MRSWARLRTSPSLPTARSALIIAPHPDDEAIGAGGLIAMKRAAAVPVDVVFLSHGEASHAHCCALPREDLVETRAHLAQAAALQLGLQPHNLHWLDLPDGAIPASNAPSFEPTIARLQSLIAALNPDEIYCPHPHDGWADHHACAAIAAASAKRSGRENSILHYLVWAWNNLPIPQAMRLPWQTARRIDIGAALDRKQRAIHAYMGLAAPCGKPYSGLLPHGVLDVESWPYEIFFQPHGEAA